MEKFQVRTDLALEARERFEEDHVKKVEACVAAKDKEAANAALLACISEIDKACTKGVYHKNTASRKVSRLTKAVNAIA